MDEQTVVNNPVLWHCHPKPMPVTAYDVGIAVVGEDAEKQAAIFRVMVDDVAQWTGSQSWAMQCRSLALELGPEYRAKLSAMLSTLIDHLDEGMPRE